MDSFTGETYVLKIIYYVSCIMYMYYEDIILCKLMKKTQSSVCPQIPILPEVDLSF